MCSPKLAEEVGHHSLLHSHACFPALSLPLSERFNASGVKLYSTHEVHLTLPQLRQSANMPFFNRRTQPADADTATSVGGTNAPTTEKSGIKGLFSKRNQADTQERAAYSNQNLNARPRFGQWLKGVIFDIITMVIMGIIGLGVNLACETSKLDTQLT